MKRWGEEVRTNRAKAQFIMQNLLHQTAFASSGVTPPWARLARTQRSVFVGFERVCLMCVHVRVHAGGGDDEYKGNQGEPRGKLLMGKLHWQQNKLPKKNLSKIKLFRVTTLAFMTQYRPQENRIMPAPVMAGILLTTLSFHQICSSMLHNVDILISEKDVT